MERLDYRILHTQITKYNNVNESEIYDLAKIYFASCRQKIYLILETASLFFLKDPLESRRLPITRWLLSFY